MVSRLHVLVIPLLLTLCLAACTALAADDRLALVAVANHDDRITWTVADNMATFDIYSPSGIGCTAVRLMAGAYPERVRMRFHLAGLEALRFAYDTTIITVSVPSTGGHTVRQQVVLAAGQSQDIAADSPYWMQTTLVAKGPPGANAFPLRDGYIEVELPPHFLRSQQTAFMLEWVDFYR